MPFYSKEGFFIKGYLYMSTKVSVIVPVYNAERYVAACLDSLINQSLEECEFIFVNDGSTDRSKTIIEEYQEEGSKNHFTKSTKSRC